MAISYGTRQSPSSALRQQSEDTINQRLSPVASAQSFASNTVSKSGREAGAKKSGTQAHVGAGSNAPKAPKFKEIQGTTRDEFDQNISDAQTKSATMASATQTNAVFKARDARQKKYEEQLASWEKRQREKSIADLEAANRQLEKVGSGVSIEGTGPGSNGELQPVGKVARGARQEIVDAAASLLGTTYSYGGGGHSSSSSYGTARGDQNVIGIDCSGLTSFAYYQVGITIPRHSRSQVAAGHRTSVKNARPGDIIGWYNNDGSVMAHVAVYAGNGKIIEANSVNGRVAHNNLWSAGRAFAVSLV